MQTYWNKLNFGFLFFSPSVDNDTVTGVNDPQETDFPYEQGAVAGANLQVSTTMREHEKELIIDNMEHLINHTSKINLEYVISALSDCIPDDHKDIFKVNHLFVLFSL